MLLLVDSDSICYAESCALQKDINEGKKAEDLKRLLYYQLDKKIKNIIKESGCSDYRMFLSGSNNYRELIDKNYKANRKNTPRPELLSYAREHLVHSHHAEITDWIEADDAVSIHQLESSEDTCIAHIDKDIDQIQGKHFKWSLRGNPSVLYHIDETQAWRKLYIQALTGDKVDNIMYYLHPDTLTWRKEYGVGEGKAVKIMAQFTKPSDMRKACEDLYDEWGRSSSDLENNLELLTMIRTEKDANAYIDWAENQIKSDISPDIVL